MVRGHDISDRLIGWYTAVRRDLPWRETTDPYRIWLSEVILQQTRVAQGLDYYLRFVERFPDVQALARADVSVAMSKGTDVAMDVAMVTLMNSDLLLLPRAVTLSRRTVRIIRENLFWAFGYNVVCIPVAAGVLYPVGLLLTPMWASAAMAFSSVSVVLNSLRLR